MKKLILILTIFLLINNVLAIDLDENKINELSEEELQTLIEEYNSLSEEEIQDFVSDNYKELSLRDLLEISVSSQEPEIPGPVKKFLPFNLKINRLDKSESFIIAINKNGNLNILDDGKYHMLAEFNFEDLIGTALNGDFNGENLLENANLIPNSFKGALALNTLERITKQQIVKQRTFGYKTIGIMTTPISWFIK